MASTPIQKEVKELLRTLSVKPTLNGYFYWPYAVEEALKRGELNYKICSDIYGTVAKKYNTTASKVERCMRTVTESCQSKIKKHFEVDFEKITNKEFLALMVEKMIERRKKDERKTTRTKKTN